MNNSPFEFHIDVFRPDTLPMSRLADYLEKLAQLMGDQTSVHFDKVAEGSAVLAWNVQPDAAGRVRASIYKSQAPNSSNHRYFKDLNNLLRKDNAVGELRDQQTGEIILFPGRTLLKPTPIKVREPGHIDGVLVRIGGTDNSAHAMLEHPDHPPLSCDMGRSLAKDLATHLYGPTLRLFGDGIWERNEEGQWVLEKLYAKSFEVLREDSIADVLKTLAALPGNEWKDLPDPISAWKELRESE